MRSPTRRRDGLTALTVALLAALSTASCADRAGEEDTRRADAPAREVAREGGTATPTTAAGIDPDDFVREIDNPYLPLEPGTTLTYESQGHDGQERTVVEVTERTRKILGVTVTVVRDRVYRENALVEDTRDWFAQDREGNVWYFGEDSRDIEDGEVVSTEGSWEAGTEGAHPGIVMPADPRPGDAYPQENAPGVAEDQGEVLSRNETVTVPAGSWENVLKTRDTTPLEPDVVEHKYYARGVGLVAEEEVDARGERSELVIIDRR
ncbi:hypothetical protein ACTWP5_24020 [Streptomyces sp. 4N509B]|uniref:hypothetical protein n=1 Tax=Streptomyces sp. 4N509B TaxID=3457413 RepID=UPI003FD34FB9